jgi:hypothetical protein
MSHEHQCIFETVLKIAEADVRENRITHKNPDRALGGIALTLRCLKQVQAEITCSGPAADQAGQRVCPLRDAAYSVRGLAASPWPEGNYDVRLAELAIDTEPIAHHPGQYL